MVLQVIMKQMEIIGNDDMIKQWCKKMGPPLVTLLSAEPEVQYVALRNINLIVQKRPQILAHEVKVRCRGVCTSCTRCNYATRVQASAMHGVACPLQPLMIRTCS